MATWKLETRYKKNIQETEYFHKDEQVIEYETWWRWGYAKFDVPDDVDFVAYLKDELDIDLEDDNDIDIYSLEFDVVDHGFDDGVAANIQRADLRDKHHFMALNRVWHAPVDTCTYRAVIAAELRDHRLLTLLDDEKTRAQPDQGQDPYDHTQRKTSVVERRLKSTA